MIVEAGFGRLAGSLQERFLESGASPARRGLRLRAPVGSHSRRRGIAIVSLSSSPAHLRDLESESIFILREAAAEFARPVILYSIGKDSSVLLRLSQKAFYPGRIPFSFLHVDTGFKFPEMIDFRDRTAAELGLRLIIHSNTAAIGQGASPLVLGTWKCCAQLKTQALLDALRAHAIDAAIGGARREEERSRAKERVYSFRDSFGQWDPKSQRPELWSLYNGRIDKGESMRVFPLSDWTELDVWQYIRQEEIPVVPLYFAREREVLMRDGALIPYYAGRTPIAPGEIPTKLRCRMRSLGCACCTGAIRSDADTIDKIVEEVAAFRHSERQNRIIDHDRDGSMELKKREGYF
jgi:sulfate adenylyltransferase subunit 2